MEGLFFLTAFFAEVVGTIAGFGSSTIFLPLALLFVDFKTALILVALFHIIGNVSRIGFFRHGLDKRMLIIFGIPSVLATFVGALLVASIPQDLLKALLGIFLLLYASVSLWEGNIKVKQSKPNAIVGGAASGFLAGLIGTGGAVRGAFLTAFGLSKEKYIATAAAIAFAIDITRIPIYFAEGFLSDAYYWYLPILFIIAFAGSFVGKQIVTKLPQKVFKKIVFIALILIGIKFIWDFLAI